jgi:hypothetical protein
MRVSGEIEVLSILDALDLTEVPQGCELPKGASVIVEGIEVDDDVAMDELDIGDSTDAVDPDGLQDLSSAIRRGDKAEAEHLLDRLFAENSALTERIQRGRYSNRTQSAAAAAQIAWG